MVDNCPSFRLNISAIKTPTYNLGKFLVPLLETVSTNMYTVKNSFEFAKEIVDQDQGLFRAGLDVKFLFNKIHLKENIRVCCDSLFSKIDFEKCLRAALQNNFCNFEGKIYKQTDGVVMGSPVGPTLANAFLCFHEQIWFNECPDEFKPVWFRSPVHLEKLQNYLNSKHRNIRFTCEKEHNNPMPFLDILITRNSNGLKASVYHKAIFSGVYSNFNSFISEEYKVVLIFTSLFRTFSIVSDFSRFHLEVCHLKEILKKKAIPIKLIDRCIKSFLNERLTEKRVTLTAEKKDLVIVLPFLGK